MMLLTFPSLFRSPQVTAIGRILEGQKRETIFHSCDMFPPFSLVLDDDFFIKL